MSDYQIRKLRHTLKLGAACLFLVSSAMSMLESGFEVDFWVVGSTLLWVYLIGEAVSKLRALRISERKKVALAMVEVLARVAEMRS